MALPLLDQITQRRAGICLYGFAPPKRTSSAEQLASIAAQQVERLSSLDIDGVIIYDIQDEAQRTPEPRPFPFLPTVAPDEYAHAHLSALDIPKVVYHSVAGDSRESFIEWLAAAKAARSINVLVGAPSRNAATGLGLREAYGLVQAHAPELTLGGIAIAERHERGLDEHERMLSKSAAGCRFFVTQAVYDVTSTLSLLSDYALALQARAEPPQPVVLTFSPCGSLKTLAFMKWLGIRFPRWLEKGIPVGVNVESVSIRKAEIDDSVQLIQTLRGHMRSALG